MAVQRTKRFDFRPGMHKPHPIRNGLIFLAFIMLFFLYAATGGNLPLISGGGYTVRAVFSSGVDLRATKTPVRVGGVDVGDVTGTSRTANGKAVIVTMNITGHGFRLTNLTTAHVYWRTLLGYQYYIQLSPGAGARPLGGATIPLSRTGVQVEIDQVLSSLTAPSRTGLQQTFGQFATAFASGNQAGATIDALSPSMKAIAPAFTALQGTQPGDLSNTVTQANRLVGTLNRDDAQLTALVPHASTTFGATAAQQASLVSTLQNGPSTLDATRSTLVDLDHTLRLLNPVTERLLPGARAITPAADTLDPALVRLSPLLNEARPTLVSLRPALQRLASASSQGVPLLNALMPTINRLNSTILPEFNQVDPETNLKLYEAIGPTFETVDDSAKMYDADGHVQRFHAVAGGANTIGALPCSVQVGSSLSADQLTCPEVTKIVDTILGG